ncbi:MAG: hypothetical protein K8S87_01830 [Planctomycetes bacterium]|nr:hypothetical protein [Planctomycetota bacterium]
MHRFGLLLSREFALQWRNTGVTGLFASLFLTLLLIFIAGYAYENVQTIPDISDISVIFCFIFLITTQFAVSFLGARSSKFENELKLLPCAGSSIFLSRHVSICSGISLIYVLTVPAFLIFFNLDVSIISVVQLVFITISVAIAQISIGLITQFNYLGFNRQLSNFALLFALPFLFPVFTANLSAVMTVFGGNNAGIRDIFIIIALDILYFVAGFVIYELTAKR